MQMDMLPIAHAQRTRVEEFQRRHRVGVLTLFFSDLVGFARLKQELGDAKALALVRSHHDALRQVLSGFPEGEEIDEAGDAFFIVFAKPSDALRFSLELQTANRRLSASSGRAILDRVGIHSGEVFITEGGAQKELFGLQVDTTARIMGLGEGDQVLMSRFVFDNARQALKGQDVAGLGPLAWLSHGDYVLKGVDEPMEVCEVGEVGLAVLKAPGNSEKAHRHAGSGELVLGWRPAVGQKVPGTQWVLERQLGEGGFGEVWLAQHDRLKEQKVFKFCFRADRVRSLKRELTLFRVLKERIGNHPGIVSVEDVFLDEPPYYLMMQYVPGKDLRSWSNTHGGLATIPLETRLEIVAQVADALEAAHDSGIIHRDIKPSNILISGQPGDSPHIRALLTDFGIGQVLSAEALAGITQLGFTQTLFSTAASTGTGTHMYMAPELLSGKPASKSSDIYSLGVVLYQVLAGDLARPLTVDWKSESTDALLAEDIEKCVSGLSSHRFTGAAQLAQSLRNYGPRKEARNTELELLRERERAAYRRGIAKAALFAGAVVLVFALLALYAFNRAHEAARERTKAQAANAALETSNAQLAEQLDKVRTQETEKLVEAGPPDQLLASLASTLRYNKTNQLAKARFLAALEKNWLLPLHQGGVGPWKDLAESAYSSKLALVDQTGQVSVWDLRSMRKERIDRPRPVSKIALSRDGSRLLLQDEANNIILKGVAETGERKLGNIDGKSSIFRFAGDSMALVSSGANINLWKIRDDKAPTITLTHKTPPIFAEISPDGSRVLSGTEDGSIYLWRLLEPGTPTVLTEKKGSIQTARVSSSGQMFMAVIDDSLFVWDIPNGKKLIEKKLRAGARPELSPDGSRLIWSEAQTTTLWTVFDSKAVLLQHQSPVAAAHFDPNGTQVLTLTTEGELALWDSFTGTVLAKRSQGEAGSGFAGFLEGGATVLTLSQTGKFVTWDARSSAAFYLPFKTVLRRIKNPFHPDGKAILVGSEVGGLKWLDLESGAYRPVSFFHGGVIFQAAVNAKAQKLAVASGNSAKVFDLATGTQSGEAFQHEGFVFALDFSTDGAFLGTASRDKTARIWNLRTGQPVGAPCLHDAPVSLIAFNPKGETFVTASDSAATLWRIGQTQEVARLKHEGDVLSLEFSKDGKRLLTSASDHTCTIWDVEDQKALVQCQGHSDWVRSASFSPDSKQVLTASDDGTVRVWDALSGRQLLATMRHEGYVLFARFSPDAAQIISGGVDGVLKTWSAKTGQLIASRRLSGDALISGNFDPSGSAFAFLTVGLRGGVLGCPAWPSPDRDVDPQTVEAIAGVRLDSAGTLTGVPLETSLERGQNRASESESRDGHLAWFYADRSDRSLFPGNALTLAKAISATGADWNLTELLQAGRAVPRDDRVRDVMATLLMADFQPKNQGLVAQLDWLTSGESQTNRGLIRPKFLAQIGRFQQAVEALDKVVKNEGAQPEFWLVYAQALGGSKQAHRALEACDKGLALTESLPLSSGLKKNLLFCRARTLSDLGRRREAGEVNITALSIQPRSISATPDQLDLSSFYNVNPAESWHPASNLSSKTGNDLATFPLGVQTFDGIPFDVRGLIQLASAEGFSDFPEKVVIPIEKQPKIVHVLHASGFANESGVVVGNLSFNYSDGTTSTNELVYGRDISDWWVNQHDEKSATPKRVWKGVNAAAGAAGFSLGIFKCDKENPHPEKTLQTIEYSSAMTRTAPFILGITLE